MPSVSFSGIASGIDGDAIIEATIEARRLSKAPLENKLNQNKAEAAAFDVLREKLLQLEEKLRPFATFSGNTVSKNVLSSNENIVTAAVSGNANPGTLVMTVHQLASAARLTFDNSFSSPDSLVAPGLLNPATMSFTIGTGPESETFEITVDSDTKLSDLAVRISDAAPGKVGATLVNVGTQTSPSFKLMVSSATSGIEKGSLSLTLDSDLIAEGTLSSYQEMQARDAIFDLEGLGTVYRSRNVINDLIPGVSLELKSASSEPVSIQINNDPDKTAKRVQDAVEAFNEVLKFINSENRITRVDDERGTRNEFGNLTRTRVDDQLIAALRSAISQSNSGTDGMVRVLSDLGITTDKNSGELKFDADIFSRAMNSNGQQATALLQSLADRLASAEGTIRAFTSFNGLIDQAKNSKKSLDESITRRLAQIESNIEQQKTFLKRMFARLEETVGQMNSNATALTSLIQQGNNNRR
ncbi:MAG TPA: flagellar filament capping protein FliD [Oligoflexia bacterium]|nr:flagellar filament capping protein FliD [Oligoflexia bacterium]HMP47638.1 flagellar filament capping protein FliD [Oligoflexia bacterium]